MRAQKWEEAAAVSAEAQALSALNDLAVSLHQCGRLEEAVALLEPAAALPGCPAEVRLNQSYMSRALTIERDFEPSWTHHDHDGASCPEVRPAVSVIVRTYRRADLLKQALSSLALQTFRDFETIVVDDSGGPAAKEAALGCGLSNLRYAAFEHGGRVQALNRGLEMAHGRYITGLDDDDVAYPRHLQTLVEALDGDAESGAVYAGFTRVGLDGDGRELWREERVGERQAPGRLSHTNPVPAVMLMARRECFEKAGRFCPLLDLGEDWEMWLRLGRVAKIAHLPAVTAEIRERPGDANITNRRMARKYECDNLLLFMHRRIVIASEPRDPAAAGGYRSLMRMLGKALAADPALVNLVNLRGLWDMKKPYAWAADQGRWFRQIGDARRARQFYMMAARLSPLEPKAWAGLLRPARGRS